MGLNTFLRGWCLCEMGVATAPPISYWGMKSDDDSFQMLLASAERVRQERGDVRAVNLQLAALDLQLAEFLQTTARFDHGMYTEPSDRKIVEANVLAARGSIDAFDAHLLEQIKGNKMFMRYVKRVFYTKDGKYFARLCDLLNMVLKPGQILGGCLGRRVPPS